MPTTADHLRSSLVSPSTSRHTRGTVGVVALVSWVLASISLVTSPAAAAPALGARSAAGPVAGTIFVANAGADGNGSGGTGPGSITLYRPGATGDVRPETVITKGVNGPGSVAVDSTGDLWVANNETGTVVEYSRAELAKASPAPTVTISYGGAGGLAFDPSGDLWADNGTTVVEFTKTQLATSGSPAPKVTLSPSDNCSPVFDASGDLWLGSGDDSVSEWSKSELAKSGSPPPKVTVSSSSLMSPCKPAFDHAGDLWAGNYQGISVVEFTKAELARSGSRAPKVIISSLSLAIVEPGDVAFDGSGDLWVPNAGNSTVVGFTKSQLAKSGSPTPAFNIAGSATGLNWPWAVAIEP